MGELMPFPKPAEHGRFLQPSSVLGDRVDFISQSTYASGRLTLQATGDGSLQDFGTFSVSFSYSQDDNVLDWDSTLAWNYSNFYVDGGSTTVFLPSDLYRFGADATSTRGRKSLHIYGTHINNPDIYSHLTRYYCTNVDSSSHTIDITSIWKYIVMGNTYAVIP